MKLPVYLDYQATTPIDPRVLEAMMPFLTEHFGNASSSTHSYGWYAQAAVEKARTQVAELLECEAHEIIFTSGSTESNNLALKGVFAQLPRPAHLITLATEHQAILAPARSLKKTGVEVTVLGVQNNGIVSLEALESQLKPHTRMISVMHVNNEIGVIQPLAEISKICREKKILFHSDATQAPVTEEVSVKVSGVDLASLSSHKIYGPKGVGALYLRRKDPRVHVEPLLHGGDQEKGLRSGTLNVAGIVGFGQAANLVKEERQAAKVRLKSLRDRFLQILTNKLNQLYINGDSNLRVPFNLNLRFAKVKASSLLSQLRQKAAFSVSSACESSSTEGSHVLAAIGLGEDELQESVRISFGRFTTEEEIDFCAQEMVKAVEASRND